MNKPTLTSDYTVGRYNSTSRSQTLSLINSQTLLRCYPQGNFYLFSLFFSFKITDQKTHQKCLINKKISKLNMRHSSFSLLFKKLSPQQNCLTYKKKKNYIYKLTVKLHGDFSSNN